MKFFGGKQRNKPSKDASGLAEKFPTPIHAQHAVYTQHPPVHVPPLYPNSHLRDNVRHSQADDQQWEVVSTQDDPRILAPSRASSLPSGASPPMPSPPMPRSPSPYSSISNPSNRPASIKDREPPQSAHGQKKKPPPNAPVALGILRALDPTRQVETVGNRDSQATLEERSQLSEAGHGEPDKGSVDKKERRGFWNTGKDKRGERTVLVKERGREKDQKDDSGLTRMIGFLTATASEDWALVLEVCDRASANPENAKEAVRALRREFRYGEPPAQLSAARLWAIMWRNCSEIFVAETASRKFLITLDELITSSGTSPVVRERLLDVVGAAAYNSPKDSGFRSLWKKVKPADKPEEGVPFDRDDAIINPPTGPRHSQNDIPGQHPSSLSTPTPNTPTLRKRNSPTKGRIIPPEEDIRRLFQECSIGMGNAALLSDALAACKPERLKSDAVIKEFYAKCRSSQELIFAQIPWATAGADHSRATRSQLIQNGQRPPDGDGQTTEEKLLGELLKANGELLFVLKQYEDLERVAVERRTEDISRKQTRMDPRYFQSQDPEMWHHLDYPQSLADTTSSRSPSPSLRSNTPPRHPQAQPFYHSRSQSSLDNQNQLLAPPPAAPHGPRSPQAQAYLMSRTPSSGVPSSDQPPHMDSPDTDVENAMANMHLGDSGTGLVSSDAGYVDDEEEDDLDHTPIRPSAKALGKRRLVEGVASGNFDLNLYQGDRNSSSAEENQVDSDQEEDERDLWLHPPVKYAYDAAAERTQQRIRDATAALLVNGVH